ncbi:hypothetical protein ACFQ0M_05475 [Kitasatospora aburaviensis]
MTPQGWVDRGGGWRCPYDPGCAGWSGWRGRCPPGWTCTNCGRTAASCSPTGTAPGSWAPTARTGRPARSCCASSTRASSPTTWSVTPRPRRSGRPTRPTSWASSRRSAFTPHAHGGEHLVLSLGPASCGLYDEERRRVVDVPLTPGLLIRIPELMPHSFANRGAARLSILAANTGFGIDHEDYAITAAEAERRQDVRLAAAPGGGAEPAAGYRHPERAAGRPAAPLRRDAGDRAMICPHCSKDLRQRDRSGHRCDYCRKDFALDPKVEGPGLHDIRIRTAVRRITDDGRLTCTVDQLRYALLSRGRPGPFYRGSRGSAGCLSVLGVAALVAALALHGGLIALLALAGVVLLGLAVRQYVLADQLAPPAPVRPRWDAGHFHDTVAGRWKAVYAVLPTGLVEDDLVRTGPPPAERSCWSAPTGRSPPSCTPTASAAAPRAAGGRAARASGRPARGRPARRLPAGLPAGRRRPRPAPRPPGAGRRPARPRGAGRRAEVRRPA